MKLWQVKRSQSLAPGLGMPTDGQKNEFLVALHVGQIRQCGMLGMQESGDPSQEFDVVCPFDDHQHTHRLGIFDNSLR